MQRMAVQPFAENGLDLAVDEFIAFTENLPALRMADDDAGAADILEQRRGDLAGKGTGFFRIAVLRGDQDVAAGERFGHLGQGGKDRGHDDFDILDSGDVFS